MADQTTATQEVDQAEAELRLAVKQLTLKNSGENKRAKMGNNGHLNTSTGVDQTGTKQVKPSSQGGFRKASQFYRAQEKRNRSRL